MAVSVHYFTEKGYGQGVVDSPYSPYLDNYQQFLKYVHCNQCLCVFVVRVNVLFGFERFLLKQCVYLSVKHLETSTKLDELMKHLLGNYYAKSQYRYLFVEALKWFD